MTSPLFNVHWCCPGVNKATLEQIFVTRRLEMVARSVRNSAYYIPLDPVQSQLSRDAIAKAIYKVLIHVCAYIWDESQALRIALLYSESLAPCNLTYHNHSKIFILFCAIYSYGLFLDGV